MKKGKAVTTVARLALLRGGIVMVVRIVVVPLALLIVTLSSSLAFANGLPADVMLRSGSVALLPKSDSALEVAGAEITVDVRTEPATVNVNYDIWNSAAEDMSEQVVFFVPGKADLEDLQVIVAGVVVKPTILEGSVKALLQPKGVPEPDSRWLDPTTGQSYEPGSAWSDKARSATFAFPVDVPGGGGCAVDIRYGQHPSIDRGRFLEPVYRYDYHLWPADRWKRFGPLSLAVLTDPSPWVSANVSLQRGADGSYVGRFDQIPVQVLSVCVHRNPLPPWIPVLVSRLWMMRSGRGALLVLMLFLGASVSGILANSDHLTVRRSSLAVFVASAILVYFCLPESLLRPGPEGVVSTRFIFFPVVVLLACIVRLIARDTRYYPGHRR